MSMASRFLMIALVFSLAITTAVAQTQSSAASALSTEMLTAARNGDVAAVKQLLAKGEDVNAANPDGVTALMIAGAEDHLNVVLVLLEAGADARMKTASGKTAALFAAGRGHDQIATVLNEAASMPPNQPPARPAEGGTSPQESKEPERDPAGVGVNPGPQETVTTPQRQTRPDVPPPEVWTDPATGLMWPTKDITASLSWDEAVAFCHTLSLGGYSGWRLPTIEELQGIYDPNIDIPGVSAEDVKWNYHFHVKGGLKTTSWSNSYHKNLKKRFYISFYTGGIYEMPIKGTTIHALCVRSTR